MSKVGWERIWICFLVVGIVLLAAVWLIVQDLDAEEAVPASANSSVHPEAAVGDADLKTVLGEDVAEVDFAVASISQVGCEARGG